MKASEYYSLLKALGLGRMSRAVGSMNGDNSFQMPVFTADSFVMSILQFNGKGPVWTSQNAYVPDKTGKFGAIYLDNFFVEVEGTSKDLAEQRRAYEDMLKVVEFCERNGMAVTVAHSGNKSFHVRIRLNGFAEPWTRMQELNRVYKDCTRNLAAMLSLKTVDYHCAEAKRLLRVPFTIGGAREGKPTHCVPIPVDLLSDFKAIQELSVSPVAYPSDKYTTKGAQTTLDDLASNVGHRWVNMGHDPIDTDSGLKTYAVPEGDFTKYLEEIFSQRCVLNENLKRSPSHYMRVAMVAWMRFLDFSVNEAKELTDRIAEHAQWDDRQNKDRRDYQVEYVMRNGQQPWSCRRLKEEGVCVGESCSWFKPRD